ncbi:hypothetical protein FHR32_006542 [Streptosporangium album]|uniref:Uncharacterized protein n=1 Tax=Streptosporangium album TaxID=47479 RepID=A0A7W7S1H8_9ACTN|nr:hypothetical protein [Streptosporangium album]MBB4942156.1 hypothetical protein [Streptosporangium album]
MPTQTVELPQLPPAMNTLPSVTTDAPHERAWHPPYAAPSAR